MIDGEEAPCGFRPGNLPYGRYSRKFLLSMCSWMFMACFKDLGGPHSHTNRSGGFWSLNTLSHGTTFSRASWDGKPQGAVKAKKQLDVEVGTISGLMWLGPYNLGWSWASENTFTAARQRVAKPRTRWRMPPDTKKKGWRWGWMVDVGEARMSPAISQYFA